MTTTNAENLPLRILPGVCPPTDCTEVVAEQYTAADKIRFVKGRPQKLDGWLASILNGTALSGCVRTIFSAQLDEKLQTILGSNKKLFALFGSTNYNITPLNATTIAIANSLDTHFATLAADPLTTTSGSNEITIADTEALLFKEGDSYVLSGATAVNGISAPELNKTHLVRGVAADTITIKVVSNASSSGSGGGASITRTSGLITVNDTAHGQEDTDRVGITGAADTGGVLAAEINTEFEIRNVTTDTFDVMTVGEATSSATSAGGAATEYQDELADGICDETSGQGYGMGRYGVGLYGTALLSSQSKRFPRIWFCDVFGAKIITTPGNGDGVYEWDGQLGDAPTLIANAPTELNYTFVSDNILVTLGADGVRNRVKSSDIGDLTEWTASSTNQVFEDDIEGAGRLWTHVSLNGTNLLFTKNQCYTFRYIGLPLIWEIKFKDNIGCVAPMARVVVKGVAYWQGENNFYMWRGGNVEVIPSNVSSETTLLNYVFKDINRGQLSKCYAWYNKRYDEIWFHYPSAGSIEVDRVARYHVTEKHWTPDTFDRLAAEYPNINTGFPRLVSSQNVLYRHEIGYNDDQSPMAWSLTTNLRDFGTDNVLQTSVIPDSIQTGDITFNIKAYSYPQSAVAKNEDTETVTPTTEFIPLNVDGRFLQYTFSGEALDQQWIMGQWYDPLQESSRSE